MTILLIIIITSIHNKNNVNNNTLLNKTHQHTHNITTNSKRKQTHTNNKQRGQPTKKHMSTLIYFHGNAGHIGMRAYKVKPYLDFGLTLTWIF